MSFAASLSSSTNGGTKSSSDLERIESEYIKNLQQQVYFLELEANYLREEARKAAELQPQMSAEAKRMVTKLAELHSELEADRTEIKRQSVELELSAVELEKLGGKLKAAQESHSREKRLLLDEISQLKREKELLDRSIVNKDAEIMDVHSQMEVASSAARTADNKTRLLESQLTQKSEQMRLLQQTLDEKRTELMKSEAKLRESEEKIYTVSSTGINDKVKDDLRDEIRLLRQKLKEMEHEQNSKLTDDSRENIRLQQQIAQLQQQLDDQQHPKPSSRELTENRQASVTRLNDELQRCNRQIEEKDGRINELETCLESVKPMYDLHQSVDPQTWLQLSRLVDGLGTLSNTRPALSN